MGPYKNMHILKIYNFGLISVAHSVQLAQEKMCMLNYQIASLPPSPHSPFPLSLVAFPLYFFLEFKVFEV